MNPSLEVMILLQQEREDSAIHMALRPISDHLYYPQIRKMGLYGGHIATCTMILKDLHVIEFRRCLSGVNEAYNCESGVIYMVLLESGLR